jgi:hypothetical protein
MSKMWSKNDHKVILGVKNIKYQKISGNSLSADSVYSLVAIVNISDSISHFSGRMNREKRAK